MVRLELVSSVGRSQVSGKIVASIELSTMKSLTFNVLLQTDLGLNNANLIRSL